MRRAGLLLAVMVLVAVPLIWISQYTIPQGSVGVVVDGQGVAVGELGPGRHFAYPGSSRPVLYSTEPATLRFPPADGSYGLFDAQDRPVVTVFTVTYSVRPGEAGALHNAVNGALEDSLEASLRRHARPAAAGIDAAEPGAAQRLAVALGERLQLSGLAVNVQAGGSAQATDRAPVTTGVRVLVVGIDSGDWKNLDPLLEAGKLPHLAGLLAGGVRADLASLKPMLSPLLWTTMATGVSPDRHGILDFITVDPATGTPTPVTRNQRRAPTVWNTCTQYGVSVGLVGWLATWPAETVSGHLVSDRFGFLAFAAQGASSEEGMTWPPDYVEQARALEVSPDDLDAAFWRRMAGAPVSQFTGAAERGFAKGDIAGNLALTLTTALTHTAVAEDIHAQTHPRFLGVYYEMVDAVSHLVMQFTPPRRDGVSDQDWEYYRGTLDATQVLQDELLGRLLALADENTVVMVVSDHGFKSDHQRPAGSSEIRGGDAARWHREPGIFALAGPGVRRGVTLTNTLELVDIAPTLHALLGLPLTDSLEGRVVDEAFTEEGRSRYAPHQVESIDWRPEVWSAPRDAGPSTGKAASTEHNNLGLVLEAQGRTAEAEAEFNRALAADPQSVMARNNLAGIMIRSGRLDQAERLLSEALAKEPQNIPALYNRGLLRQRQGRFEEGYASYGAVLQHDPSHVNARVNRGHCALRLGRPDEADGLFREVLRDEPQTANAEFGLGILAAQSGDLAGAAARFRQALAIDPGHRAAADNLSRVEAAMEAGK